MDLIDDTHLTRAHRFAWRAGRATSAGQLSAAVSLHQAAADAFRRCRAQAQDQQALSALHLLIREHESEIRHLQACLRLSQPPQQKHSQQKQQQQQEQQKTEIATPALSSTTLSSPSNSTSLVPQQQSQSIQPISSSSLPSPSSSSPSSSSTQDPLQGVYLVVELSRVLQFLQHLFSSSSSSSSTTTAMSYPQLQSCLREVQQIAAEVSIEARQLAAPPQAQPTIASEEEDMLCEELGQKLALVEQLHDNLVSLDRSQRGMTASDLSAFLARFHTLRSQHTQLARSQLLHDQRVGHATATLHHLVQRIQNKVREVEGMLDAAAKQIKGGAGEEQKTLQAPTSNNGDTPPVALSAEAQLKLMMEKQALLEKQLHHAQKQIHLERSGRLKAEKSVERYEQKWRILNEKVAAKKAEAAAAAAGGATTTGSGSGSSSSSSSLHSPGPFVSQVSRSLSATSPSLHVARPVQVSVGPVGQPLMPRHPPPPQQERK